MWRMSSRNTVGSGEQGERSVARILLLPGQQGSYTQNEEGRKARKARKAKKLERQRRKMEVSLTLWLDWTPTGVLSCLVLEGPS